MRPGSSVARLILFTAVGLVLLLGALDYLLSADSDSFVLLPDEAHAAQAVVSVPGGAADRHAQGKPGVYFLDVTIHAASIAESWIAHYERGATVVPARAILPPGGNQKDQRRIDRADIDQSKEVASYVALKALHRKAQLNGAGVLVAALGNPAASRAGLAPGAVIVAIEGRPTPTVARLRTVLKGRKPGKTVSLRIASGGKQRTLAVRLIGDSTRPGRGIVGIIPEQVWKVQLGTPIRIATKNLGGPSAGLAFTLEIYDALSGHKLAHGRRIAVTGTIAPDGTVGVIGGMKQKTIGAIDSHANLLIVPVGNLAEARRYAGSLKVVGVRTFAEALRAIRR
jgi:PDZ domain-containing protein